jgi:hypothetical protein
MRTPSGFPLPLSNRSSRTLFRPTIRISLVVNFDLVDQSLDVHPAEPGLPLAHVLAHLGRKLGDPALGNVGARLQFCARPIECYLGNVAFVLQGRNPVPQRRIARVRYAALLAVEPLPPSQREKVLPALWGHHPKPVNGTLLSEMTDIYEQLERALQVAAEPPHPTVRLPRSRPPRARPFPW